MPFISSFDARRSFPTAGTGTTSNYTSSSSSSSSNPRGFDRFSSSRKSTVFERPSAYTPSSSTSSFTYSSSRPSTLERLDRYTVQMIFIKSKTKIRIFYKSSDIASNDWFKFFIGSRMQTHRRVIHQVRDYHLPPVRHHLT